jgi:CheY-like chemotaxis protein
MASLRECMGYDEGGHSFMARVLVVEDNPDIRTLLSDALADAGFEARAVENGAEALTFAAEWRPDVMILDLMMPVMDGPTFLRNRQRSPVLSTIPVMVLTAQPGHHRVLEGLDVTVVLRKPYDLDELVDAVGAICDGETGRQQVG